jgi:glycosyltransferase involved in cell wall biosynthesis
VAVPTNPRSVRRLGKPPFQVLSYRQAQLGRLWFPNGGGVDLVHAFTPRELVRRLTIDLVRRFECPYVVHLEDNEEALLAADLGGRTFTELQRVPLPILDAHVDRLRSHPIRAPRFIEAAAGVTAVIDRLLELKPASVPGAVVWPGFDEVILAPPGSREKTRAELRLESDDIALVYTGNIHEANLEEVRSLYLAVLRLREAGRPVVLVKAGWTRVERSRLPDLGAGIRDLGHVGRARVAALLAAADVLVQPGRSDPFNDYRFPAKLPEFRASRRPGGRPRAHLGLRLEDGVEALLLERGDPEEIAEKVALLAADPDLGERIGAGGREFALRELRWSKSVDRVVELYERAVEHGGRPSRAAIEPLVKVIVLAREPAAAADGIHGFCLLVDERTDTPEFARAFADPRYVHVAGAPVVAVDSPERAAALPEGVHVAVVERATSLDALAGPPTDPRRYLVATADSTWLRKLVLQGLHEAPAREPIVFVDGPADERAVAAIRAGVREGIRQFYAGEGYPLSWKQADALMS